MPVPWQGALAALVAVRLAIPLVALAASGHALPGLPRYDFVALTGDATGFYAAAREFMAAWGRLPVGVVALLALVVLSSAVVLVLLWRRRADLRPWLLAGAAAVFGLVVSAAVTQMNESGAAVFGWPLVWSLPMLPYRALGLPLDPDVAFGFGLPLALAANAVTVVATAYVGLHATGRRGVGLLAAALYAFWPLLTGTVAGERAWENGTWTVDVGLALYTEPLSTALTTVALALLLSPGATDLRLAVAGVALSLATVVKLSNGLLAAAVLALLLLSRRRAWAFAAGAVSLAPVAIAYWPLGYRARGGRHAATACAVRLVVRRRQLARLAALPTAAARPARAARCARCRRGLALAATRPRCLDRGPGGLLQLLPRHVRAPALSLRRVARGLRALGGRRQPGALALKTIRFANNRGLSRTKRPATKRSSTSAKPSNSSRR